VPETFNPRSGGLGFDDDPARRLIAEGAAQLAAADVENPRLDAEAMLAAASHTSRTAVISGLANINYLVRLRYAGMIARRRRREPLAYILGRKEFYSLNFEVTPAVLIPRPETETAVTLALELLRDRDACVCDLGTGSGAIGLAIGAHAPRARVTATDISAEALALARRNAAGLKLESRVHFRLADCFEPLDGNAPLGRFDLIVSNPPYVCDEEIAGLTPEISRYEPRIALAGGRDGLELYRRIGLELPANLERNGRVIVEIGAGQAAAVTEIMRNAGATTIRVISDLAGLPRVVLALFHVK